MSGDLPRSHSIRTLARETNIHSDCCHFFGEGYIPYSLKFSRIKYFVVLPNSAQKQIFTDKIFMV